MRLAWIAPRRGLDHEWIWPVLFVAVLLAARFEARLPLRWPCPLKMLSGIPCPGCGGTRALRALGRLEVLEALRFNPLAALGGMLAAGFALVAAAALLSGGRRLRLIELSRLDRWTIGLAVLLNWLWLWHDGR